MNSRLAELKAFRDEKNDDVAIELVEAKGDDDDNYMKEFDEVGEILKFIAESTENIEKLRERTKVEVKDEQQKQIMTELDETMMSAQREAKKMKEIFDVIAKDIEKQEKADPNSNALLVRKNMLNTSIRHFQETMREYQAASSRFKATLRKDFGRQARIVNKDITEDEIDEIVASDDPGKFFREELGLADDLLDTVAEIEERYEGMKRIEQGVREIYELFQQLATLVEIQQEYLDNIETNVQQTRNYTEKAVEEIRKGEKSQKQARKCSCALLVGLLVLLVVVIAVGVPIALKK